MSTIPLLARRRLCNTFNAQEVGQLRAALQGAGVEFVITQDSRPVGGFSGYGTSGPALHLGPAQPPSSTRYMCTRMIWPWPRAPYRAPSDSSTEPPPQSGRRLCSACRKSLSDRLLDILKL